MLRHYLMMTARSFARHRLYSFINVVGLSIALACAILILLFVRDQLSYDAWIPGTANLYRLQVTWYEQGGTLLPTALSPFPALNAMKAEIPGVEAVTHVVPEKMTVMAGDRQFLQTVTVVVPNFFQVIKLPLVSGRPATVLAQPESIVLSQGMARRYFGRADPVGRFIRVSGVAPYECKADDGACFSATHTLRVPFDTGWSFNESVHAEGQIDGTTAHVRVSGNRLPEALSFINRTWRSFAPTIAMQHYLMSDAFDVLFTADERQGAMFVAFVTVAIVIACLGLFGLVVFTAERRTKEVGIRKISGAHTTDIVRLMLWRISVPVLAANLIAWPLAYVYLHRWLEGYTDRISLSPLYFLGVGGAALLIAWATVYANTLRLARASPIHALRYE